MKVTENNIDIVEEKDRKLLNALLQDIKGINGELSIKGFDSKIYIDYQTFHNEYSPERVDPCPDFYHKYSIRVEKTDEIIGEHCNIMELDYTILVLVEAIELLIFKLFE